MGQNSLNDDWREGRSGGWDELIDHSSGNKGCIVGSVFKHNIWAFGLVGTHIVPGQTDKSSGGD